MSAGHSLPSFLICAVALTALVHGTPRTKSRALQEAASTQGHQPDLNKADIAARSCLFDFERGEIADCIRQTAGGELLIAQRVLKELHFNSYGLAPSGPQERAGCMLAAEEGS